MKNPEYLLFWKSLSPEGKEWYSNYVGASLNQPVDSMEDDSPDSTSYQ
jgi:hypothetical protein